MIRWLYMARLVPLDVPLTSRTWTATMALHIHPRHVRRRSRVKARHSRLRRPPTPQGHRPGRNAEDSRRLVGSRGRPRRRPTRTRARPTRQHRTQRLEKYSGTPFLRELSVVRCGAIEGAVIRNRRMLLSTDFLTEPTRTPAANPPASRATPSPSPPKTLRRSIPQHRAIDWHTEINRRIDLVESQGLIADVEEITTNLAVELGHTSIERELARHHRHRAGMIPRS